MRIKEANSNDNMQKEDVNTCERVSEQCLCQCAKKEKKKQKKKNKQERKTAKRKCQRLNQILFIVACLSFLFFLFLLCFFLSLILLSSLRLFDYCRHHESLEWV
jgi:hypothetical protein